MTPEDEQRLRLEVSQFVNAFEGLQLVPIPRGEPGKPYRRAFDVAMASLHYAGPCQRVGRCMRLLLVEHGYWVGGIVLGSTFPNIDCRDSALGLKKYVRNASARGLRNPWSAENHAYWTRLQSIVNHARTFVFPSAQGRGVGVEAHRLLLTEGLEHWRRWYPGPVSALDTLCDHADSGLFRRNGWTYVGKTKGYGSDRTRAWTLAEGRPIRNNVGLSRNSRPWEVWIRPLTDQ